MQSPHDQNNSYGHHQYLPGRTPAVNEPQAQLPTAPSSSLITSPPGRDSPPPFPTASCEADYNDRSIQNHDNGSNAPPPPPHGDSFQTLRPSYSLARGQPPSPLPWSSGLYACFQDMSGCCLTFWCPCVVFGRIAEIVDRGSTSCFASGSFYLFLLWLLGCPCIYSCFYRSKMRGQFNLAESPCPDCCVHCFCEYCALCQEYRELNTRGFNMSKGWHANMDRRRQQAEQQLPPNVPVGMTR